MKIGEVSKLLGINSSAIRFYERHGLINSKNIRRTQNGYRNYEQADLDEIRWIIKLKNFGLNLKEIKRLLGEEENSCSDLVSSLDEQIEKCKLMENLIKDRIASLSAAKNSCESQCSSSRKVRRCCVSSTMC